MTLFGALVGAAIGSVAALTPGVALADGPPKKPAEVVTTGSGPILAAHVAGDRIIARVCPKPGKCSSETGTELHPSQAVAKLLGDAKLRVVRTKKGKQLIEVRVEGDDGAYWVLLLAPSETETPRVVWKGWSKPNGNTEYTTTKDGAGEAIRVTTRAKVCGHDLVASVVELDPDTLAFDDRDLPDPAAELRAGASDAHTDLASSPKKTFSLLRIAAATGEDVGKLTDGNADTEWSPAAPNGAGFAAFNGPADVGVTGVEVVLGKSSAVPASLFLITSDGDYNVPVPQGTQPGSAIEIVLQKEPHPLTCVAVVSGEPAPAPAKPGAKPAAPKPTPAKPGAKAPVTKVSFAEVKVETRFDDKTLEQVASAIDPTTPPGGEAIAILRGVGPTGLTAAIGAYATLEGPAKEVVRNLVDEQRCPVKLALYVPLLASDDEQDADRATENVIRCGAESVPVLIAKVQTDKTKARSIYADELGLLPPEDAIPALVAGLVSAENADDRTMYRRGLVRASKRQKSTPMFDKALSNDGFASYSPVVQVDLLRGVGERVADTEHGPAAFEKVWTGNSDFRTRYLLLPSAAALAKKGDAFAVTAISDVLTKSDNAHLRMHAAELVGGEEAFAKPALAAVNDADPRVREAALTKLPAERFDGKAAMNLAASLSTEPWTFVKKAAVAVLAKLKDDAAIDKKLVEAMLVEPQPEVRSAILDALAARGAKTERDAISERAADDGETATVRISAIHALAAICDVSSVDDLEKLAKRGLAPATEGDAKIAIAAIQALGRIHPKDLEKRIGMLAKDGVIADIHSAAQAALKDEGGCKNEAKK